jgi:hypothetical protein
VADAPPKRKLARDEEIVGVVVKVILDEGTVSSQKRLAELVNRQLKKRGMHVTGERVRVLAVKSGLVGVSVRARVDGPTPELERCPVCRSKLRRSVNKTLTGAMTQTGYKCTRCPWWTGRDLRIPQHYVFNSRVSRTEKGQVTFSCTRRDVGR